MSKEPFIAFKTKEDFDAAIAARIEKTDLKLNAELRVENDKLRAEIAELRSASKNAIDDYAPFAAFPELQALVRQSNMRPNSLPALVALEVWKASANATAFPHFVSASEILPAIPAGKKGERDLTTVMRALENAAAAFLEVNVGLGLKVDVTKGSPRRPASAKARIFRFRPVEEVAEVAPADAGDGEFDLRNDEAA
jgi:hypothetical protein